MLTETKRKVRRNFVVFFTCLPTSVVVLGNHTFTSFHQSIKKQHSYSNAFVKRHGNEVFISDLHIATIKMAQNGHMLIFSMIILFGWIRISHQTNYTCSSSLSCGCSTNSAVLTRIVGGENASAATWGWAVSISIANTYLCGGSIISSSWVLTAAHCVNGYTASQITIFAGSTVRFSGTQRRSGSKLIVHPSYSTRTYVNDIALLQLTSPLSMSDSYVSSICLPSVSSSTLSAGEWPPAGTSVNNSFTPFILFNIYFDRLSLLDGVH